jgi:hypothetical protein
MVCQETLRCGISTGMTAFIAANEQHIRHNWGVPGQGPRPGNDEGFNTSGTAAGEAGEKGMLNQKRRAEDNSKIR